MTRVPGPLVNRTDHWLPRLSHNRSPAACAQEVLRCRREPPSVREMTSSCGDGVTLRTLSAQSGWCTLDDAVRPVHGQCSGIVARLKMRRRCPRSLELCDSFGNPWAVTRWRAGCCWTPWEATCISSASPQSAVTKSISSSTRPSSSGSRSAYDRTVPRIRRQARAMSA